MSVNQIKQILEGDPLGFVSQWLPEGEVDGREYKALNPNRADGRMGSFSVNLNTHQWADFATDDKGGDLISLFAFVFCNSDNSQAVKELATMFNVPLSGNGQGATGPVMQASTKPSIANSTSTKPKGRYDGWVASGSVSDSPAPLAAHYKKGRYNSSWPYHNAQGQLTGFACRFDFADGSKEVLPLSLWQSPDATKQEWRWAAMQDPRPLYNLPAIEAAAVVLVVEGEKSADAAAIAMQGTVVATTWAGGSKALNKTDWTTLKGKQVVLWPDADEPGAKAMQVIGSKLIEQGCSVWTVNLPEGLPGGWDAADFNAEQLGPMADWLRERMVEFKPTDSAAPATNGDENSWQYQLLRNDKERLVAIRDNVFLILKHHPEWRGVFAYNEFANSTEAIKSNPCGISGELDDQDDLQVGHWLAQNFGLPISNAAQLTQGVQMAAHDNRYHPVKDYLESVKWDGKSRLYTWMHDFLGAESSEYTVLAGAFFLIGMVARIYQPGCQMQHMPILEGTQGSGKSTALRILGGQWFNESGLDIGNKDAYIGIQGVWLQEVAELDAFNKKDATAIKSFVTAQFDKFREPFGRRDVNRPRQTVFAGTTNQHEYFKDQTGNRRFWPILVGDEIDTVGLTEARDQLFAEALDAYNQGARWHPTREEEALHFKPQQEEREITDPREIKIMQWLDAPMNMTKTQFTTLEIMEGGLDTHISKADNSRQLATYIGQLMVKLGWSKKRSSDRKATFYIRPERQEGAA